MNHNRYKRDSHSKALVLARPDEIEKFLEKQRLEHSVNTLKDEIHTMRLQMQEILSNLHPTHRENR